jgi:hypothetical protein
MRTRNAVLLLAFGTLGCGTFAMAGCSGNTDGSGGGKGAATPIAQADLAARASDAVCNNIGKCCADWGFQYNAAKCAEGLKASVQESIDRAASASGVTYNANTAGECVAAYAAWVTACTGTAAQQQAFEKACNSIWTGTKAAGQPCTEDFECAGAESGSAFCATMPSLPDAGTSGGGSTCMAESAPPQRGTKGGPCSATMCPSSQDGYSCAPTVPTPGAPVGAAYCWVDDKLFCDPKSWQCVDLVPVGGSCPEMLACEKGAYCKAGTCLALGAVGSACEPFAYPNNCQQGNWCNTTTKLCEATKNDGQPCASNQECKSSECEKSKCIPGILVANNQTCGVSTAPSPPPSP